MFDPTCFSKHTDQTASTIHHTLRAPRRRLTIFLLIHFFPQLRIAQPESDNLQSLHEDEVTISVRQLAREIVSIEEGVSKEHATGDPYHNVYNSLIQTHLPKLDDVGGIEYDHARKTVSPDHNLVALAMTASLSFTVSELIFYSTLCTSHESGLTTPGRSIDD